jgi:copper transport protein
VICRRRRPPRPWWRIALALTVGTLFLVATAGRASAHAALVSVTPSDGARLDAAPTQVTITFSEHVSAPAGGVRVLDTRGNRVDTNKVSISGAVVTVPLKSGLGTGGYIVTWRIVSADSHPVSGASVFAVGNAATPDKGSFGSVAGEAGGTGWKTAGAVARAAGYLGILLATGAAAFLALVHDGERTERARLVRVALVAAVVGLVGLAAGIPISAAELSGNGLRSVFDDGVARTVLGNGVGWTLAAALFGLAVVAIALTAPVSRFNRGLAVAGAALAAVSFATAGHPDTLTNPLLAGAIDGVHLLAAAVWFGGLVALWVVLRSRHEAISAARVVARFSLLASVALVAVSAAGTYLAWREVGSLHELTATTYGRLILAKVAAVSAVALLGLLNNRRLVPAITRAPERAAALLRRTVRVEATVLVGVIAITSVLVNVSPPVARAASGPINVTVPLTGGAGSAELAIEPGKVGNNIVHVYLADAGGQPLTLQSLKLRASLPAAQLGPLDRDGQSTGLAHFTVDDLPLTLAGQWTIDLVGQVSDFKAITGSTQITIRG